MKRRDKIRGKTPQNVEEKGPKKLGKTPQLFGGNDPNFLLYKTQNMLMT